MKQTEALQLADELAVFATWRDDSTGTLQKSAAELRRLHEANQAMLAAAKEVLASFDKKGSDGWMLGDLHSDEYAALEAAIAKGEQA
tara:strand:- start:398 stop:658 length:261 start_codon:yes stop_codon:yes gene_type:complete